MNPYETRWRRVLGLMAGRRVEKGVHPLRLPHPALPPKLESFWALGLPGRERGLVGRVREHFVITWGKGRVGINFVGFAEGLGALTPCFKQGTTKNKKGRCRFTGGTDLERLVVWDLSDEKAIGGRLLSENKKGSAKRLPQSSYSCITHPPLIEPIARPRQRVRRGTIHTKTSISSYMKGFLQKRTLLVPLALTN